jgi:hypothetical protein
MWYQQIYFINSLVCSSVCPSRSQFWVSGPETQIGTRFFFFFFSPFKADCPGLKPGVFFFFTSVQVLKIEVLKARSGPGFFFPPFSGCPGLIPGFFFFFSSVQVLKPRSGTGFFFFFSRPFPAGCPGLKQCWGASE